MHSGLGLPLHSVALAIGIFFVMVSGWGLLPLSSQQFCAWFYIRP